MYIDALEKEARALRAKISELNSELEITNSLINHHYSQASDLLGRLARSDRIPGGLKIDYIDFKTWAPNEPQSVSGYRLTGAGAYTTIHVNSPGYEVHDTDQTCA